MTPKQQRLYDLLHRYATEDREKIDGLQLKPGSVNYAGVVPDVSIVQCYSTVYAGRLASIRDMQQKLGPLISRINKHIAPQRIVPGERKRTYRLETDYKVG
jgi:hypothetical protein